MGISISFEWVKSESSQCVCSKRCSGYESAETVVWSSDAVYGRTSDPGAGTSRGYLLLGSD